MTDNAPRIRIGIDVGGTFTHAVAIHAATLELVGKSKVPTTHGAAEGVARGVVDSLLQLLDQAAIPPDNVLLIAHSTTQATNALLEGDVATVGIIGMGAGLGGLLARRQTHIKPIELAPRRYLQTHHRFIDTKETPSDTTLRQALNALREAGAEVVVAAEAFSVDDPRLEQRVCDLAREMDLPATATHHVSRLHGLGIRTRTAVINASMVPTMLNTADMTESAVREAGISAPVMIMRSDGGVMDIEQMRRRPILTMLSGPAAGVAAALLYARVSDGVFLEVGGTSTDISVIKNGRCQVRTAEVGGQTLHVSTLDVRTVGVAGGSMIYCDEGGRSIAQVGPRSSHIAGLPYLSFSDATPPFAAATYAQDSEMYLVVRTAVSSAAGRSPASSAGESAAGHLAVTPTCASNQLNLVPSGDPAAGKRETVSAGFKALAQQLGAESPDAVAEAVLKSAVPRVIRLIEGLVRDYKLDPGVIRLIGGGGGASAIVPFVAREMGLSCETAENADVISAIGVALALVRDTVERTVINPAEDDIRRIRAEAYESVLRMGAEPSSIEVFVEVDAKRNLLRATAEGATEVRERDLKPREVSEEQQRELVAASTRNAIAEPERAASAADFEVWSAEIVVPRLWKFFPERRTALRVLDATGAIRWSSNHGDYRISRVQSAERELEAFAETYTRYSDAGATIPRCFVLLSGHIIDLSGLAEMKQVLELLRLELQRHGPEAECVLLVDLL